MPCGDPNNLRSTAFLYLGLRRLTQCIIAYSRPWRNADRIKIRLKAEYKLTGNRFILLPELCKKVIIIIIKRSSRIVE